MGHARTEDLPHYLYDDYVQWEGRYERDGVRHYIIVDPKEQLAKIYSLHKGRYVKVMDATDESCEFDLGKCQITFDFSKIWA